MVNKKGKINLLKLDYARPKGCNGFDAQLFPIFQSDQVKQGFAKPCSHSSSWYIRLSYFLLFPNRPGCGMVDIWDLEDEENRNRPSCCNALEENPEPFKKVFSNQKYYVFQLHRS